MNKNYKEKEAEKFAFLRVPKVLISHTAYKKLSADAVLLYGILFDRMCLSVKNRDRFTDRYGDVFVYCTLKEICETFNCGHDKATRLQCELVKHNLLCRKCQGKGKPAKLYVLSMPKEPLI